MVLEAIGEVETTAMAASISSLPFAIASFNLNSLCASISPYFELNKYYLLGNSHI